MNSRPLAFVSHNKAVHKSKTDPCHHHPMFTIFFIYYYTSDFLFAAVLLGFGAASSTGARVAFLEDVLLNLALSCFLFLELPYESFRILPFFDFLSPLPIYMLAFAIAIIRKSLCITKSETKIISALIRLTIRPSKLLPGWSSQLSRPGIQRKLRRETIPGLRLQQRSAG